VPVESYSPSDASQIVTIITQPITHLVLLTDHLVLDEATLGPKMPTPNQFIASDPNQPPL